jgi:hypothetical protein
MTKYLAIVAIVLSMAVPALAGDGAISGAQLNALGLSGMQPMSDAQASQVRGKGYSVEAWGQGTVNVLGSTANNGYDASKSGYSGGNHSAVGANVSVVVVGAAVGHNVIIVGGIAGGASFGAVH